MAEDFNVNVSLGHSEEVLKRLAQVPELLAHNLTAAMLEAELLLEREAKTRAPVGLSGAAGLRGSIAAIPPFMDGDTLTGGIGTSAPYAVPVELGSKPHFPPVQPLADWVTAKLGVGDAAEARGIAFCIARKIAAHGTKGQHFFKAALNDNEPAIKAMFDKAVTSTLEGIEL